MKIKLKNQNLQETTQKVEFVSHTFRISLRVIEQRTAIFTIIITIQIAMPLYFVIVSDKTKTNSLKPKILSMFA